MLNLYGPDAKPNDIYLYFGANTSIFGNEIRYHYDPLNPTPSSIENAKNACGEIRDILKVIVLGIGYGMGAKKLASDLRQKGYQINQRQCYQIWHEYWKVFKGIKRFEEMLLEQYDNNGGWIFNGRGRILTIDKGYTKDIVNRFVQSTGHDVLLRFLMLINNARKVTQIPMYPWLPDEHDATVWEIEDKYIEHGLKIFHDSYDKLRQELKWDVPIIGEVKIGKDLSIKL
jgi:DNA polymerase I-like protein with 3'-5' exonuclease and polymerase domains